MCHMETVEFLILKNLLHNEEYIRKVIPFIKGDYFEDRNQKIVFEEIIKFDLFVTIYIWIRSQTFM